VRIAKRALTACGLVTGAVAFFLLGTLVSQRKEQDEPDRAHPLVSSGTPSSPQAGRRMFAPSFADDPYVLQEWKQAVEMLERRCRDAHEFCVEARNARLQIKELQ